MRGTPKEAQAGAGERTLMHLALLATPPGGELSLCALCAGSPAQPGAESPRVRCQAVPCALVTCGVLG